MPGDVLSAAEKEQKRMGIRQETGKKLDLHTKVLTRGVQASMGKFKSLFLQKHVAFPGYFLFTDSKYLKMFKQCRWETRAPVI